METIHRSLARSGLIRNTQDKVLGGVCSGLGHCFGIDPWALRVLVVISLLLIPGSQLLLYPIAWVLMPVLNRASTVLSAAPVSPVNVTKTTV